MLAEGKVLCLHRGRSEVGPRALGHRSIIAHAVSEEIRDRINAAKGREAWRPLAPICRQEDFGDYFAGDRSMGRFMLFTCDVLNPVIPAVTHVDGTARVQCIDASDTWLHPALGLLKAQGHHPVIVNTSFNCAGEPIVETLDHAIASFLRMGFDYLVTELGVFAQQRPLS
jgi:carbamoyltransferase